ncbi:MAG: T9SS type A sorting domain-containing protein [Bacteroidota bacterium]|nr:T9SS type A sorting domain-containing protein [Bacteroidota bacterium]
MKKIILILLLAFAITPISKAQTGLCETTPCTLVSMDTEWFPIVKSTNCANGQHNFVVMVIITYATYDCNGKITKVMNDPVFIDDRAEALANGCLLENVPPYSIGSNPISALNIRDFIVDAINAIMNDGTGATNGTADMLFPGSCNSLVKLNFPAGSFFIQAPDDRGIRDTFFVRNNTILYQSIPCGEACCKVVYEYRLITTEEGLTHSKWIPTNIQAEGPHCESLPQPDYNNYTNKLEADLIDPNTGLPTKVNGMVVGQEPCEMMCPRFNMPPHPMFKTKSTSITPNTNLGFSAKPTLVEEYIQVVSDIKVKKFVIYDNMGKKHEKFNKINGDKINLDGLKTGIYFIQFYLENNDVKTIKIFKQ